MEKAGRRRATSSNQAIQAVEQMFICLPGQVDLSKSHAVARPSPFFKKDSDNIGKNKMPKMEKLLNWITSQNG